MKLCFFWAGYFLKNMPLPNDPYKRKGIWAWNALFLFFLSAMVDLIDHRSKWLSVSHKLAAFQGLSSTGVKDKWLKPALSNLIKKTTCTPFAPQVFDKFLTIERRFVPGCFCVPKRFVLGPVWLRQKRQFLEKRHPWFCYYKLHAKKQNVCNVGAVEIQKVLWILEQFPVVSISWTGTHGRQLKLYRELHVSNHELGSLGL